MASSSSIFQGMVPLGLGFAMVASGLLVAWSYRRRCRQLSGEVERIRTSEAALRDELAGKAEEFVQVRQLFEDSPASLLVLGMDGGVLAANRAACALHGLTVEELVHESGGVPADLMEDVPAELERMGTLEGGVVETLRMGSGNRMIPVELRGRPIAYGGRKAVLVHEVDLTTLKRQQALLREEQERYRAVVGALSEGVLLVNAEGRIVTANPSAARILGLMEGDLVGTDLVTAPWRREWMDGTEMLASDAPVAVTLRTGEGEREVVMGLHNPAGPKRWLSVTTTPLKRSLNGKVLSVVVSFREIPQEESVCEEGESGLGSRLSFEVPPASAAVPDPLLAPGATGVWSTPLETSSRPVLRVLIVEDHPVNRQLTETMVQKFGIATAVASNGREALEFLEQEGFSMVLMDVQMPEMDGLTATRTWRAREAVLGKSRIPIVALTAHSLPQDKAACLNAGMDDYMCKPLRREALSEMLVRYLSGSVVLRTEVEVAGAKGSGEAGVSGRKPVAGLTQNMLVMLRDANRDGLGRVRAAISVEDGAEASRALHFVKGGCALLQAAELTGLLKELEGDARAGRLDRVAEQLPGLEAMIEALMKRAEIAGA